MKQKIVKRIDPFLFGYSYLKASTGFSFDALYAGTTPETTPIRMARPSPSIIRYGDSDALVSLSGLAKDMPIIGKIAETSAPNITPKIPPTRQKKKAYVPSVDEERPSLAAEPSRRPPQPCHPTGRRS